MTSSTNRNPECGLDTMLIVYSLLGNHPASSACEQFIRTRASWLTTTSSLLEAKAVLTKVYGVEAKPATEKLTAFTEELLEVASIGLETTLAAMKLADISEIDFTDALLLLSASALGLTKLATDDRKLTQAALHFGITVENPITESIRQQMAQWELANLPAKGLPRMLRQVYDWLSRAHPQAAVDFWSHTGNGSHLP